jgi:WD40 repeat protein
VKLGDKNGMVMAVSLFHQGQTLTLAAGYENGMATVAQLADHGIWTIRYQAQCHSQPVLSLDVSPNRDFFLTSSADAIIAKHPLPAPSPSPSPSPTHPPPPGTTLNTPPPSTPNTPNPTTTPPTKSLLTAALQNTTTPTIHPTTTGTPKQPEIQATPLKTVNTKHAGQQSLRIRSDARLFATAGWDARVRVYSATTLAEVAVLKWHAVGCYAAAFAAVVVEPSQGKGLVQGGGDSKEGGEQLRDGEGDEGGSISSKEVVAVPKLVDVTVRAKRVRQAREGHWLAAGSKDGKVSLWDVF